MSKRLETDEELRARCLEAYGMWGAFASIVLGARGATLDKCADHLKLARRIVEHDKETP